MKIVISGGLGYVGGRLSKYFVDQGHAVVALSRQAGSLNGIKFPKGMEVVHPDAALTESSVLAGADAFIHLAAMNEHDCVKYPEKAIEVNITGTLRWLNAAHRAGIQRFIYFSTAHVYGKPLEGFFDENTQARPVHPYAITHKCAEDYALAFAAEKGMVNTVVRLTNAFGGPAFPTADRWTLLVNDLCQSAVKSRQMTLLSDGSQERDFICIADVCKATAHILNFDADLVKGQIFNVGAGVSMTVWQMAQYVQASGEQFLKESVELTRKPPSTASKSLTISIAKLTDTGFHCDNRMSDEIELTLKYFLTLNKEVTHGH